MGYRIVVTDIDETLVIKHITLTENARNAIKEMQQKGCLFVVASGRPLCQIQPNLEQWGIEADVIIAYNGVEIYFTKEDKKYTYNMMSAQDMKDVIDLMRPFDLNLNIVDGDVNCFSKPILEHLLKRYKKVGFKYRYEKEEFFYQQCPKIMLRLNEDSNMEEIEKYISEHPSERFIGFKTGPTLVEFSNKNVSKGFALKEICRLTGIDISQTVGIGDTTNDNDLIKEAGLGVCMLNGSDDTKAIADVITEKSCDDDGWADFVTKEVLPNI